MINIKHTGSSANAAIISAVNNEFCERLEHNYDTATFRQAIGPSDVVKILTTMTEAEVLGDELKDAMLEHIESEQNEMDYHVLAEIAIIFATRFEEQYKRQFFVSTRTKFMSDMRYLSDDVLYKIIWAYVHSGYIAIEAGNPDWEMVKENLVNKCEECGPQVLADLIVLSSKEAKIEEADG